MDAAGLKPMDIDQCVITDGPGSYTGVRIAMTVAKVMCAMRSLPLYTLGTLQLYAGRETCTVLLDARGKRAYAASFENGACRHGNQSRGADGAAGGRSPRTARSSATAP
jgi:tRNA threonylcarbamoyladenosine biosynthesis protein TsaB